MNEIPPSVVETLLSWLLGLVSTSIVGIVAMHVRISVFAQRLLDHMRTCEEMHQHHQDQIKELRESIRERK